MNGLPAPPAIPETLLAALVPDSQLRDGIIGDLAEDYRLIASRSSARAATLWYWSQLVRSAIPLAFLSFIGTGWRGWMRLGWAVLAGYAALATLVVLSDLLLGRLLPYAPGDIAMPAASLAAGVLCAIVAGAVAARVGGRSPIAAALALGVAAALLSAISLTAGGDGTPRWYQIGLMVIVLPSATAGAWVRGWLLGRRNKDGE